MPVRLVGRSAVAFLFVALLATLPVSAMVSPAPRDGVITRKILTWDDFRGAPEPGSPFLAYTRWNVNYSYTWKVDGSRAIVALDVTNTLDPSSWVKRPIGPGYDELLAHEQRHYDFSVLLSLDFKKTVTETVIRPADVDKSVRKIFADTHAKYVETEKRYDRETSHGTNESEQARWHEWFDEEIARLWPWR